jgi:hypothetical protein
MTTHYFYEIASRDETNHWQVVTTDRVASTRDPQSTARSVIERWINDQHGQLPGGQVFIFNHPKTTEPNDITASTRVRIYTTHPPHKSCILAAAYIGHHNHSDARQQTCRLPNWLHAIRTHDRRHQDGATPSAIDRAR